MTQYTRPKLNIGEILSKYRLNIGEQPSNDHSVGVSIHTRCTLDADRMQKRHHLSLYSRLSTKTSAVMRMLVMVVMMMCWGSAWGDTVVLSNSNVVSTNEATASIDGKKIVSLTDHDSKGGVQQGANITIGGTEYTALKVSGSRKFDLAYGNKVTINSVKLYATSNNTTTTTITNNSSSATDMGVTIPAKGETPIEVDMAGVTQFYMGAQSNVVIVVDYTVNAETEVSTDATLKAITLNGNPISSFAAGTKTYNLSLAYGTTVVPTIGGTVNDPGAVASVTQATSTSGAAVINVTAEDNTTTDTYTVNLSVSSTAPIIPEGFTKLWFANDWDKMTAMTSIYSVNGISTYNVAVDGTKFDNVDILGNVTQRFNFGGAGAVNGRRIEFPVTGPCEIVVWGSNNNVGRCVILSDGTNSLGELCTTTDANKGTVIKESYIYTGEAKTLYAYSKTGGYYVLAIGLKPVSSPTVSFSLAEETTTRDANMPWGEANKVELPQLPEFTASNITVLSGLSESSDNTTAIQTALNNVPAAGGMVVIPAGEWLTGPITLKSKTVLHLKAGAKLKALPYGNGDNGTTATPIGSYPTNGTNSSSKFNYKMLISCAANATDVVVEGEDSTTCIIDGQGSLWWSKKDVLGTRPPLIRFEKGQRFLVRNITLQNSAGTNLTLGNSGNASHFTVHSVAIKNPSSILSEAQTDGYTEVSHNTDGIPVWGPYVNIYDCTIDTGDDNIVFDSDSRYGHVWSCKFKRGHGASFGSYTEKVHHIIYEGITFNGTAQGFRLKTNRTGRSGNSTQGTNGAVHDITCQNSTMTGVADPIVITSWYDYSTSSSAEKKLPEPNAATAITLEDKSPEFKDILFKDITVTNPGSGYTGEPHQYPIYIYGLPEMTVKNVTFDNVKIASAGKGAMIAYAEGVKFINGSTITGATSLYDTKTYHAYNDLAIVSATKAMTVGDADWTVAATTDYTTSGSGTISLSSSDESVATIVDGKVHAVAAGTTTITLTQAADGIHLGGSKTIELTVSAAVVPFQDFELNFMNTSTMPEKPASVESWDGISLRGDAHGLNGGFTMNVVVDGPVKITMGGCQYATSTKYAQIKDGETLLKSLDIYTPGCYHNGGVATYLYKGGATTLTIIGAEYTPYIKVEKLQMDFSSNDIYDAIITANSAEQLKQALNCAEGTAEKQYMIYLPNGTYDLGTVYDTKVPSYTTIIGESRDGVIIQNHPATEGIWTSSTLRTGSNVAMQNLTLHSIGEFNTTTNAERYTALYDDGANNVYNNIKLLGRQDTYYSAASTKSYFYKSEIHGTVDFICGSGAAWFEQCDLKIEQRADGAWIVAPKTDNIGYTFNNCTIDNATSASMDGKYYFGRGWEGTPKTVFAGSYDNYIIKPNGFESDGYDRSSWAHGDATASDNNSGLTKTATAYTDEQAKSTMGTVVSQGTSLPAPENVVYKNGTLTWTAVANAACYYVYKNDVFEAKVTTNSYTPASSSSAKGMRKTAAAVGGYTVAAVAANGLVGVLADATAGARTMKDFSLDFTGSGSFIRGLQSIIDGNYAQNSPCITGVTVTEDNGTPSFVATDAENAVVVLNAKYHGTSYGIVPNNTFTVPVDGPVKFTYGTSNYSTKVTVTNTSGNVIATISPYNKNTYNSSNTDRIVSGYYSGGETTLTFTGGSYVPYFAVEKIDASEVPCAVNYNLTGVTGSEKFTEYVTAGTQITLPGRVYYKAGYTLLGWTDGTNNYELGASVTVNADMTFTPRFRENTKTLEDRTEALTIKWNLGESNGAPSIDFNGTKGFLITQATVDGEVIDVKMDIDATNGKVFNSGRNDKWAQVNSGAKFTIPHYKGATVSLESNSATTTTTVDGVAATGNTEKVYSTEVATDAETIDIVFGDGGYMSYIQTVLPIVEGSDQESVVLYSLTNSVGSAEVTTAVAEVKDKTSLKLSNTAGRIKITPKVGQKFKNGDKITFSGTIGNTSKKFGVKVFAANGTTSAGEFYVDGASGTLSVEGNLSLSEDADCIYIGRYDGSTTTLTSCEITGNRQKRTFKTIDIDFTTNPYTLNEPTTLPQGVSVEGTYHNAHGYTGAVVTVPVDGPVKITMAGCNWTNQGTVKIGSEAIGTLDTKTAGCSGTASYTYNSLTPATLTIECGLYCPSIKIEPCDYIPSVTVTYYNTDGTKLGEETVDGGSKLVYKYSESDVTVGTGKAFRGWFDKAYSANYAGKKVVAGTAVNANLNLYAIATDIETASKGSTYTYDLTKDYFYQEDHECITMTGGAYHNNHGWSFGNGGKIEIPVAGNAKITFGLCQFGNGGTTTVTSSNGGTISPASFDTKVDTDGTTQEVNYTGPATTLSFTLGSGGYIHTVKVENAPLPASDLAIVPGKETVTLNPNSSYQLVKGTDYTGSYSGTYTFTSGNTELVTVAANGTISTVGTGFGQTTVTVSHPETDAMKAGEVVFKVKVISPDGQTGKPAVSVDDSGNVTIVKHEDEAASTIYYTTDGSEPTEASTPYTAPFQVEAGTVVRAVAINNESSKSISDERVFYYKAQATIHWAWNNGYNDVPEITGGGKDLLNNSTKSVVGNKFTIGRENGVGGYDFVTVKPSEKANSADENHTITFRVIPLTGISFQPTDVNFMATRIGTGGGNIDAKLVTETADYTLLTEKRPARNNETTPYTQYPNATDTYTTPWSSIPAKDEEWALKLYVYSLDNTKTYGFRDIRIEGLLTGSEYDGVFYTVTAATNPAEGGTAEHVPAASRIMKGKAVTFKAVSNTGYRFTGWTNLDETTVLSTSKQYVISSLEKNENLEAHFVKLPFITFANNNSTVTGTVPAAQYVDEETGKLFIPYNFTLYREGWYLDYWTDGTNKYYPGQEYEFAADATLTPTFASSAGKTIADVSTATKVKWSFDNKTNSHLAPTIAVAGDNTNGDKTAIYTKSTTVGGTTVDLKMDIDASEGTAKLDNNDARVSALAGVGAQVNDGTKVTIPAVNGMKVTIKASTKTDTQFNQTTDFVTGNAIDIKFGTDGVGTIEDSKTLTYIYTGDDTSLPITFNVAGIKIDPSKTPNDKYWGFYEYIEVEYPVLPDVLMENKIVTTPLLSDKELAVNAGTVEKSSTTHSNTGSRYKQGDNVIITATAGYGYYISAIKNGDTSLAMTKVVPSAEAEKPTKATATYTVGAATGTVTVEYERLPMGKVRLESADEKLGDVDFTGGNTYENFYTKGTGYVESYFVVGDHITMIATPADDYVIDKWTEGSEDGTKVSDANQYTIAGEGVTAVTRTFFAHFKHGQMGSVIFDIENPMIVEGETIKALPDDFGAKYDSTGDAVSQAPAAVNNSYSFTVPKYSTVFKTGYTLKFWKVKGTSTQTYQLGSNNSFQNEGETITLVPVYQKNPTTQFNRLNEPVMTYEFGTGKGIRAQKVNLGKNQKTFWTAQVYVEAIDNGTTYKHNRDVGVWVQTGSKGFVRNGDLDEWASFGPGTKFYIASCAGTRVELITYAPITTTTFGGKVFTLKQKISEHEYLYECTTQLADQRVPIEIGDDYSYYKGFTVYSKKADRVNLHINVDDTERGKITAIEAVNTDVNEPIIELEDGGHSFHQGNGVKVSFERLFGYELDKIIDPDKIVDGEPLAVLKMNDDGSVDMVKMGNAMEDETIAVNTGDPTGTTSWGSTDAILNTHVFYLKKIEPTQTEKDAGKRTRYELQFNITTHRNLQIIFKEKPTYYVTYNAGKLATGVAPAAAWVEAGDKYTIPENRTLYYEGNTLMYWIDADYDDTKTKAENKTADDATNHVYEIGQSYHLNPGADLLLYPVFEKNTFSLLDVPEGDGLKVTWPFASDLGAPYINFEHSSGILVSQMKKDSEWIDLKIDLDGSNRKDENGSTIYGKFNNTASTDRCQININSILTFPTTMNCVIGLSALKEISTTSIAGMTDGKGYTKGKEVTATYTGEESSQTVYFQSDGAYYSKFEVTYKQQTATRPSLKSVKYGSTELTTDQLSTLTGNAKAIDITVDPDVTNDAVPTVTATAENGVVTVTQASIDNRSAVITLKTDKGILVEIYKVNFKFNEPSSAPQFVRFKINGVSYNEGTRSVTVNNLPISGTITIVFDRTMKETTIQSPVYHEYYTAPQGKELTFSYWNLPVNTESDLVFPAATFKDVYGKALDGNPLEVHLTVSSTTTTPVHKTFDYIVGKDGDVNDAITKANAATGTDRYYVFIPDGEYELTGNEPITSATTSDGVAPADSTGTNRTDLLGKTFNNHKTQITRANVSLIGQSTKGVTLFNRPLIEGISYTATIHTGKDAKDFYVEDLSLVNRFPYWKSMDSQGSSGAGRAVAFQDQGNRSVMKNVELWSYQDTYYSNNANDDYRGYFENCTLAGVVDWLCGDGNIWLEKCDIVIRDRAGNNVAAPSTEKKQQWGYVFNECNIKPEVENPKSLKDKNWSLARPWANSDSKSPAATYLYTKMWLMPRDAGWEKMGTGAILRFHEYHTMNSSGTQMSLGSRSLSACAPGAGSDDCILSAADAAKYTIANVMGGTDLFTPQSLTKQIDADSNNDHADWDANNSQKWDDGIEVDDDVLRWKTISDALCYFVFRKDIQTGKWYYVTNVAQGNGNPEWTSVDLSGYHDENNKTGIYVVRAANQRGGLGAPTKEVEYTLSDKYTLTITKSETREGVDYGWATICLPYNSKVPTTDIYGAEQSTLKVFAANGKNPNANGDESKYFDDAEEHNVSDLYVYLKTVDVINKDKGYVVYGPVGKYQFASSSHTSAVVTILKGNPDTDEMLIGNNNCYVLANKTYGIGFYKYIGEKLKGNRAWLPVEKVDQSIQTTTTNSGKGIKFFFAEDDLTGIDTVYSDSSQKDVIYDLMGNRVLSPIPERIYIINGKKKVWK